MILNYIGKTSPSPRESKRESRLNEICFVCVNKCDKVKQESCRGNYGSIKILLSYLMKSGQALNDDAKEELARDILQAWCSDDLRLCNHCESISRTLLSLHLQLEAIQMDIIHNLKMVKEQVQSRLENVFPFPDPDKCGNEEDRKPFIFYSIMQLRDVIRQKFLKRDLSDGACVRLSKLEDSGLIIPPGLRDLFKDVDFATKNKAALIIRRKLLRMDDLAAKKQDPVTKQSERETHQRLFEGQWQTSFKNDQDKKNFMDFDNHDYSFAQDKPVKIKKRFKKRKPMKLRPRSETKKLASNQFLCDKLDQEDLNYEDSVGDEDFEINDDSENSESDSSIKRRRIRYRKRYLKKRKKLNKNGLGPLTDSGKKDNDVEVPKVMEVMNFSQRPKRIRIRKPTPTKLSWLCDICLEMIPYKEMKDHVSTHPEFEKLYYCDQPKCQDAKATHNSKTRPYGSYKGLVWHYLLSGHSRFMECIYCPDKRPYPKRELCEHIYNEHKISHPKLTCKESNCSREFYDPVSLKQHKAEEHGGNSRSICKICSEQFPTVKQRLRHMRVVHHVGQLQCAYCPEVFYSKFYLERHEKGKHTEPKLTVCHKCGKEMLECTLESHMQTCCVDLKYKCKFCDKRFYKLSLIKRHEDAHRGEPKYKCDKCPYKGTTLHSLKNHQRLHGERKFACEYCEKRFTIKRYLEDHIRTHTKETPYVCEVCHQAFNARNMLSAHRRKKHKIAPVIQSLAGKGILETSDNPVVIGTQGSCSLKHEQFNTPLQKTATSGSVEIEAQRHYPPLEL